MKRVLLVDDEPLVLIGLQSMLNWEALDCKICGTLRNGKAALDFIEKELPDIVISDIKMPIMDGLALAKACREKSVLPAFIMLTSFEDFDYAKQALRAEVVDYLIKLELTPEHLTQAVERAKAHVDKENQLREPTPLQNEQAGLINFRERFFNHVYSGQFKTAEEITITQQSLHLNLQGPCFLIAHCDVLSPKANLELESLTRLVFSTTRLVENTLQNYCPCYATSIDVQHFNILFELSEPQSKNLEAFLLPLLEKANQIAQNYFSVVLHWAVGKPTDSLLTVPRRNRESELLRPLLCEKTPIIFSHIGANDCDATEHKAKIVADVQQYLREHLSEKLTLNDVANVFNFSPNYLSQLFAKYGDSGFIEFITETRIALAKELLTSGNLKIYEISDQLGFDSAFYFSKVFKKIVGMSPREFQQQL